MPHRMAQQLLRGYVQGLVMRHGEAIVPRLAWGYMEEGAAKPLVLA